MYVRTYLCTFERTYVRSNVLGFRPIQRPLLGHFSPFFPHFPFCRTAHPFPLLRPSPPQNPKLPKPTQPTTTHHLPHRRNTTSGLSPTNPLTSGHPKTPIFPFFPFSRNPSSVPHSPKYHSPTPTHHLPSLSHHHPTTAGLSKPPPHHPFSPFSSFSNFSQKNSEKPPQPQISYKFYCFRAQLRLWIVPSCWLGCVCSFCRGLG
jgi:hypothetical protein